MLDSIRNNGVALGAFALVTTVLLAATQISTRDRIEQSEYDSAVKALLEIVPRDRHDNDMMADTLLVPSEALSSLGLKGEAMMNIAYKDGQLVAVIVPVVAPDGYSGDINMIVGINRDGSVAGVRVLSHKETPGLGDKVELKKSQWILSFNGRSLDNPLTDGWAVRKDKGEFDQFTGATITPRAVIAKVHGALTFFSRHKRDLFPDSYLTERVPLASSMLPDFTSPDNVRTESEEVTPNG